jgi:eukaryotic-like serine/threonine-protein kinase
VSAISDNGTLVYIPSAGSTEDAQLMWVDRNGVARAALPMSRRFEHPRLSPDGRRVAVDIRESNIDVWVGDLTRGTLERLTFDEREDESPVWHPDGARIAFAGRRDTKQR